MNKLKVRDTIKCVNTRDANMYARALTKEGYVWEGQLDIRTEKYVLTVLGLPKGEEAADDSVHESNK